MICPREDVTWVRSADGSLAPFDEQRLAESLRRVTALLSAGEECLPESLAAAVRKFLEEARRDRTISAVELVELVASVLDALGYGRVMDAYVLSCRHVEIELDELAADSPTVWELDFFRQLDRALIAATDGRLALLQVRGLRACVLRLRGAKRWGTGCGRLAEDIVSYVRDRVRSLRPTRAKMLRLAVLE